MKKPDSCKGCSLYSHFGGGGFVPQPTGRGSNGLVILGEKNGATEARRNLPFHPHAAAGHQLDKTLKRLNKSREGFKIGNVISCQPLGDKLAHMPWEFDSIDYCKKVHLSSWLPANGQQVIFALGDIALRELTEFSGIGSEKQSISHLRGYPLKSKYGWVIPSYNPGFVSRGKPQYAHYLRDDLTKAFFVHEHGWEARPEARFIENPSKDQKRDFYREAKSLAESRPESPLFVDIETTDSADTEEDERQGLESNTILTVQFAFEKSYAIDVKWSEENMAFIKLMLLLPNWKAGFNSWNFDFPRLRSKGLAINGVLLDLMWMFKHWQPGLERGLQKVASLFNYPAPWKHLSASQPGFYG